MKKDVRYTKRHDLEESGYHVVIIDVIVSTKIRIINVYRSFRPLNEISPELFFAKQLNILRNAMCSVMIVT